MFGKLGTESNERILESIPL